MTVYAQNLMAADSSMRRKSPQQFTGWSDVTLSSVSARFETTGAESEVEWGQIYRLAARGAIVVLVLPQGVGMPIVCPSARELGEVVRIAEGATGLRCWRPPDLVWFLALGPW